ncbi:hypothetical protein [Mycolicibacterium komossense]|uniref:Alpha/beta hydrolase n=1 Tax=Mycolicibacterium komossense TaxID=1779 RepID=A0ABT3C8B7_9MYCO|nr:hypothetical protein [Mycolicibacterium komossense]MCV7225715.1 hypothetical protein [Mycolicibacterium komossense]
MKAVVAVWLSLLLVVGLGTACSSKDSWVEDEVTFTADGLTIHGTYRHLKSNSVGPAALLISESGNTDRNGDNAVVGPVGNMRQLATYLSDHGVATLRYDKVGTGKTGLGPYASHRADVGSAVYTTGAKAAVRFLADQSGTDKARISTYAIGEGTTHAMALATDTDPAAPKIHSLGLLLPLTGRYLDLITGRVNADNALQLKQGSKTQQQADGVLAAWTDAVNQARATGTVPPGQLPDGLSAVLNPSNVKAVVEQDKIDPVAEAQHIPAGTPVLLACSDTDSQAQCTATTALADALAHTALTFVQLKGVSHVLRDDPADNAANYAKQDPLSPQLITALDQFVTK